MRNLLVLLNLLVPLVTSLASLFAFRDEQVESEIRRVCHGSLEPRKLREDVPLLGQISSERVTKPTIAFGCAVVNDGDDVEDAVMLHVQSGGKW